MEVKVIATLAVALGAASFAASAQTSAAEVNINNLEIQVSGPNASVTFSGQGSGASSNIYTPAEGLTSQAATGTAPFSAVQTGAQYPGVNSASAVSGDPLTSNTGTAIAQSIDSAPNGYSDSTFYLGSTGLTAFTLSGNSTLTITAQVNESWESAADTLDADVQFTFHLQDAQLACQATSCLDMDHGLDTAGDPASGSLFEDITLTFTNTSAGAVEGYWFAAGSADAQSVTATTGVPEPANATLMLLGIGGLGALARRRKS